MPIPIEKTDSDAALMSAVRAGNRTAFAILVDRHKAGLVGYLTRLTGEPARSEDFAQETFVKLFLAAPRYEEQGRLKGWLYRVATNQVRSEERRASGWRLVKRFFGQDADGDAGPEPAAKDEQDGQLSGLLADETRTKVQEALARIALVYRAPLILREIEGMSYDEIARALGCPEGTVKSRINRGKALLRESLAAYWNDEGVKA